MPAITPEWLAPFGELLSFVIVGTATALGVLLKVVVGLRRDVRAAADATRPNGGSSMRDAQARIEGLVGDLVGALERLEASHARLEASQERLEAQVDNGLHAAQSDIRGIRRDVGRNAAAALRLDTRVQRLEHPSWSSGETTD